MKIKRFTAANIRDAIKQVREQQGPDAVILSNKKIDGGVEIVAAVDYDEVLFQQLVPKQKTAERDTAKKSELAQELKNHSPESHDEDGVSFRFSRASAANRTDSDLSMEKADSPDADPPDITTHQQRISQAGDSPDNVMSLDAIRRANALKELEKELQQRSELEFSSVEDVRKFYEDARSVTAERADREREIARPEPGVLEENRLSAEEIAELTTQVWSHDPSVIQMRREINAVRDLLENQLSGLAWGARKTQNPLQTQLLELLLESGFDPSLCEEIAEEVPDHRDFEYARRTALGILAHRLPVGGDKIVSKGGVIALVGPTGVGKTTTIAKLAARHALRYGANNVALVTTDNYRVGAHEQLRTYGRLLDVPVRVARKAGELRAILAGFKNKSLVLIDTAGLGQRDGRIARHLSILDSCKQPISRYLVIAATSEQRVLSDTLGSFQGSGLSGCILTKIDEAASLGAPLSVVIQQRLPVAYISDGQRVPEDLHIARPHSLISRSIAIFNQFNRRNRHRSKESVKRMKSADTAKPGTADGKLVNSVSRALAFSRKSTHATQ